LVGNGPSMGLLTPEIKKRMNKEYLFMGSRFIDWKDSGLKPSWYILTERKQTTDWMAEKTYNKVGASIAKFWVDWQPAPTGWVAIPHPPSNAHDVLNYGTRCLMGSCADGVDPGKPHLAHGKDTPLAMAQVAAYMGFNEMFLLGCETTTVGKVYDTTMARNMHVEGIMEPYYQRAKNELPMTDCTPDGKLNAILGYRDIEEVLNA